MKALSQYLIRLDFSNVVVSEWTESSIYILCSPREYLKWHPIISTSLCMWMQCIIVNTYNQSQ